MSSLQVLIVAIVVQWDSVRLYLHFVSSINARRNDYISIFLFF